MSKTEEGNLYFAIHQVTASGLRINMSKDLTVLTPNGRRQKVHCTPDTSLLQILEDVCAKQGFQPTEYVLKHHNHIVDLTTSIRFSNLPNKATLEMVESDRQRLETNITIGLLLEDGERRTAEFSPNTSLYDLITHLAPSELHLFQHPTILYMRQEVIGEPALRGKTLRQLGLIGGRAILRLMNRADEVKQAHVSSVYRKESVPKNTEKQDAPTKKEQPVEQQVSPKKELPKEVAPGPSNVKNPFDPIKLIKEQISNKNKPPLQIENKEDEEMESIPNKSVKLEEPMLIDQPSETLVASNSKSSLIAQEALERRLKIEEEVTFLGAQKAIAFTHHEHSEADMGDLPDDFYELTVEEVRKLYRDLQNERIELENTPLMTSSKRAEVAKESEEKYLGYKHAVVRIQFPDHIILQGVFSPSDTVQDITDFVKSHLRHPNKAFHLFTTPLKETIDPILTLLEAKFVPCVHMHFKWLEDDDGQPYLKEEDYSKQTSSDAASILASKYRAPSRRKTDSDSSPRSNVASSSKGLKSKVPKWFK